MKPKAYKIPGLTIQLVRDRTEFAGSETVDSPSAAEAVLRKFVVAQDRENLLVLLLNGRHRALGVNLVSLGTANAGLVHPREVYKPAILAGATGIILSHTHPSGDSAPSQEDREVTKRLAEAGKILGIQLLDHIILGDPGEFFSFKEKGLL